MISRRLLIGQGSVALGVATCGWTVEASPLDGVEPPGQKEWFDDVLSSTKAPVGSLIVYRFADEIGRAHV